MDKPNPCSCLIRSRVDLVRLPRVNWTSLSPTVNVAVLPKGTLPISARGFEVFVLFKNRQWHPLTAGQRPYNEISSKNLSVPSVTPHPEYYLDDGDLYLFVNSETVFKINSWFFKRDSPKFRKVIEAASAIPDETKRPGSSSCPFKIDEVSPDQFAKFLDIYYDTYSDRSTFTVQEWVGILKIACAHEFPKIKHVATLNLEANEEVNVAERIKLYREYEISQDYLLPHILKIIKRDEYPSDAEEVILGDAVSTLISRARQNFLVATGGRKISSSINDQTAEKALRSVPDADTIIPLKISVDSPESKGGKGKVDRSEETDNLPNGRNGSTNGHGSRHAGGGRTK